VIIIDKGANDGIAIGMPVMSANGLLGQVESVGAFTSSVRLITDPSSGVSVFLQASRAEGILGGSPERLLYLNYMPIDSKVEPGDVVITSGAGGVFPKGIVIGEVVSSTHNLADVYLTVVVRPVSRVDSFEEVVVLTSRTAAVTTPDLSKLASPSSSSKDASASSASSSSASESTSANNSSESTSGISNYGADTSANSNDGDRSDSTSSNSSTGSELGPNSLSEGGD
jgi:rod shape-determining protein MreC